VKVTNVKNVIVRDAMLFSGSAVRFLTAYLGSFVSGVVLVLFSSRLFVFSHRSEGFVTLVIVACFMVFFSV
jgi:hypothetical protein